MSDPQNPSEPGVDPAESSRQIMNRYRPARGEYRARSHESAHNQTPPADDPAHRPPQRPDIPRGPVPLIVTQNELVELIDYLRAAGSFAYDSEFIGELSYIPKLCLIQLATRERVALIDPLANLDLTPFWELICDPAVEKIVHAGQQDLEPAVRHLGRPPANIFDTQIAAGFIALAYPVSLSKLVREIVGAWMGKGLTFTHWDHRPLSSMQLRYAADDVRYLPALRTDIGARLESLGHTAWAAEECSSLCDSELYRFNPEQQYLKIRGAGTLPASGLAILRELALWRNDAARAHDVPPRAFLKDEILLDLARNPVRTVEKLDRVKGLPRPVELAHGANIVAAIARGIAAPVELQPAPHAIEETPAQRFRADAVWSATECLCFGMSIDPNLVASRQEISQFCRQVASNKEVEHLRLMRGWRRHAIGDMLLDLLHGKQEIALKWDKGLRSNISKLP